MSSNSTTKRAAARKPPNKHQPTKAEMEEVIVIPATLDQLAGAVLAGGAPRREPTPEEAQRIVEITEGG